jgi:hypothetical protein
MDFMAAEIGKQKRWIEGSGKKASTLVSAD